MFLTGIKEKNWLKAQITIECYILSKIEKHVVVATTEHMKPGEQCHLNNAFMCMLMVGRLRYISRPVSLNVTCIMVMDHSYACNHYRC